MVFFHYKIDLSGYNYSRGILAFVSFYFMRTNYFLAAILYITSVLLDKFDGHSARYFNQCTKFGAILDQLTDRLALMCFCIGLTVLYPDVYFFFQLSCALDIASHWLHDHHRSSISDRTSHTLISVSANPFLRIYSTKPFLSFMYYGNETFFVMVYLLYFTEGPIVMFDIGLFRILMYVSLPIMLLKAFISLIHLVTAAKNMAAIDMQERSKSKNIAENVFLFIPNLIDYLRGILAFVSFYFMRTNYSLTAILYCTNAVLDEFDGHAARYFNQCTKFGAILDQLTDRVALMCLCIGLTVLYPDAYLIFQLFCALDIAGHWLYVHQSNMSGRASHKVMDSSSNLLLRIYYTEPFLAFMCYGNETFFVMVYLLYFTEGPIVMFDIGLFRILMYVSLPIMLSKTFISFIHLFTAAKNMVAIDMEERTKLK